MFAVFDRTWFRRDRVWLASAITRLCVTAYGHPAWTRFGRG